MLKRIYLKRIYKDTEKGFEEILEEAINTYIKTNYNTALCSSRQNTTNDLEYT